LLRAKNYHYLNLRGLGMGTIDNLKSAFSGESQANRKYLAFARKAESDGFAVFAGIRFMMKLLIAVPYAAR